VIISFEETTTVGLLLVVAVVLEILVLQETG
jgi:hypothetical protein